MSKKTFFITTPIYYPSGSLHIGHVFTTTLAWVFRNYKELNGYEVKFLTGSDEHGQKIEEKALAAKLEPQVYVDSMSKVFQDLWKKLEIEYDYFSRTTSKHHQKAVSYIFDTLLAKGLIYKGSYRGLYSISDEEFLTITQAVQVGDDYFHPVSGHKLNWVEEETYFFKMSSFQPWLEKYINDNPEFIYPEKVISELRSSFLNKGLDDLSVTRTSFTWGIPVSQDPNHIIYVWIDALSNYITALGYPEDPLGDFKKYWAEGDEVVHLVGKEITRFHCIYWPIILKALDIPLPNKILSHGWIVTPEGKMSKSKGNTVDPYDLINEFGAEPIKYFFSSQYSVEKDGVFEKDFLINVLNADLSNNYGNLVSRTLSMVAQNFPQGLVFTPSFDLIDINLINSVRDSIDLFKKNLDSYDTKSAFAEVMNLSRQLNRYIDETKPWLLKDNLARLGQILNVLLNGIYAITTYLSIVIPEKAKQVLRYLKQDSLSFQKIIDFDKFKNVVFEAQPPLFERIKK